MIALKHVIGSAVGAFFLGFLSHRLLFLDAEKNHLTFSANHSVTWRERSGSINDGDLLVRANGQNAVLITFKKEGITYVHFDPSSKEGASVIISPQRNAVIIETADVRYVTKITEVPMAWVQFPINQVP